MSDEVKLDRRRFLHGPALPIAGVWGKFNER